MSRSKLIDACLNFKSSFKTTHCQSSNTSNIRFYVVQTLSNDRLIEYIYKLTIIGTHPEYRTCGNRFYDF